MRLGDLGFTRPERFSGLLEFLGELDRLRFLARNRLIDVGAFLRELRLLLLKLREVGGRADFGFL